MERAEPVGELQHLGGEYLRQFPDGFFVRRPVAVISLITSGRHAVKIEQIFPQAVDPGADLVNVL